MIRRGPVDIIVMAYGEPRFDGSVLAELEKRSDDGTIRILDAMILLKRDDGTASRQDVTDLPADQVEAIKFIVDETLGLFDEEDVDTFVEGMAPGSAIAVIAVEHTWAVELANTLAGSGFEVGLYYRVPVATVEEAFAALEA